MPVHALFYMPSSQDLHSCRAYVVQLRACDQFVCWMLSPRMAETRTSRMSVLMPQDSLVETLHRCFSYGTRNCNSILDLLA